MKELSAENQHNLEQSLRQRTSSIMENELAANSLKSYRSDFQHFADWCSELNAKPLPASASLVIAYLSAFSQAFKYSTLSRRVAAIRKQHEMHGLPSPSDEVALKRFMKSLRRTLVKEKVLCKPAAALQQETLKPLIENFELDTILDYRNRAILMLSYTGAFRRSELAALNYEDLIYSNKGVSIHLRQSKSDQFGKGTYKALPFNLAEPRFCPVRILNEYLALAEIENGAVFRTIVGRKTKVQLSENRLSTTDIYRIVKRYAANFSPHSLRAGFITDAKEKNLPDSSIMVQTGHQSVQMIHHYGRHKTIWQGNAVNEIFK